MRILIYVMTAIFASLNAFSQSDDRSPNLRIEHSMRAALGKQVSLENFRFEKEAKTNIQARKAVHIKEYEGQACPFSFKFYGENPGESLQMSISRYSNSYQVNQVKYFENGVVYIAWESPMHAYQIAYPRLVVRIFDSNGKTTAMGFQNGFSGALEFCYAKF